MKIERGDWWYPFVATLVVGAVVVLVIFDPRPSVKDEKSVIGRAPAHALASGWRKHETPFATQAGLAPTFKIWEVEDGLLLSYGQPSGVANWDEQLYFSSRGERWQPIAKPAFRTGLG